MWTGKRLISSPATQRWKKITKPYWERFTAQFLEDVKTLEKPYNVEFTFVRQSKHKFDYPNPLQTVLDEMVAYKWIDDDNADEIKPFFGDYQYDKKNPGVYIRVITNLNQLLE